MSTSSPTSAADLQPQALQALPLGRIRPTGWLRQRMQLQADGVAGRLDEFWPDVAESAWIGGQAEGWERGPYWLDGVVPLAFVLDDDKLKDKVRRWIDYIVDHQGDDGWLGPRHGNPSPLHDVAYGEYDVWPRMIMLKVLVQYHDATGDSCIIPCAMRLARFLNTILEHAPLHEWGRARWADLVWSLHQLHDRTGEDWLLDMAEAVRQQGYDWITYAGQLPYRDKVDDDQLHRYQRAADGQWHNDNFLAPHGVNIAMGIKAMPVWWRQSNDLALRERFSSLLTQLDEFHGQPNGLFSCDEHLAGKHPSQGTETCTVVEYLASLETAVEAWGVVEDIAARLEHIAFNALPASTLPNELAHQYVQQANQVICHITEDRIYTNNGPDANVYGLEPHFGCCTANRHQGWPKFAARLWVQAADGGLCALSYAPCTVDTEVDGHRVQLAVETNYPFTDSVRISVTTEESLTFPLRLRIPAWASAAEVVVDGRTASDVTPNSVHEIAQTWTGQHTIGLTFAAPIRAHTGMNGSVSIERGPLVYALALGDEQREVGSKHGFATWEVHPTSPWNFALCVDRADPAASLNVEHHPARDENPFDPSKAPISPRGKGVRVPWDTEHGAAAAPPQSPARPTTSQEDVTLIPYGSTNIRVTALPWTATSIEDDIHGD